MLHFVCIKTLLYLNIATFPKALTTFCGSAMAKNSLIRVKMIQKNFQIRLKMRQKNFEIRLKMRQK